MTVRVRFAPSPTGSLHLGGLRTALYNYLTARKLGGTFTLRIEDTDRTRLVPGSVEDIIKGLRWAGIEFDYGPERGGPFGPYYQSERLDLYHAYTKKLLDTGRAYRCFCSPSTLSETRERLARMRSNATYDRTCLHLTDEEVARRVKAGEKHVVRFNDTAVPRKAPIKDLVFGALQDGHGSLPTDPILLKSDSFPTYHLASVADDHEMKITHVIRGEEWLQSLPLHVDLYASLDLEPPRFAHLPLLLNPDGSKMSKRKGDVQVSDYITKGWESEAVVNWLALAGWGTSPKSSGVPDQPDGAMTMGELIQKASAAIVQLCLFDIEALTHRRTILDPGKLTNLNKQHLATKIKAATNGGSSEILKRAEDLLRESYPDSEHLQPEYLAKVVMALLPRVAVLPDIRQPELSSYFFTEPNLSSTAAQSLRRGVSDDAYAQVLSATRDLLKREDLVSAENVRDLLHTMHTTVLSGLSLKDVMNSLRYALSGSKVGPSVPEIIFILRSSRSVARLENATHGTANRA
ncbi:Glutamate--tRNA ligase mitochondrial [Tulasnella sp. 424]|nr:Glutamate--tRNA ligase mitochondrial [Tulasnella sp. 424]KAG8967378.1 Glutamate--tRNA ligase mitochondrial [Tulasnella sp. 425]